MNNLITPEMIVAWANFFGNTSIDDIPGICGSLTDAAEGKGTLPAELFDAVETRDLFKPIRSAYFAALGQDEPEYPEVQ